jgi:UDP-N-acetylglucosamine transferase subunit ALG13
VIFVTTGNFDTGFDRLIEAVDRLYEDRLLSEPGLAQIAGGRYEPRHMHWERFLTPEAFDEAIRDARLIIGHAGAGTVRAAAASGTPAIVMPRLAAHGEHYNDHQSATATIYEEKGLALVARSDEELRARLIEADTFHPNPPSEGGKVAALIRDYLERLATRRNRTC